MDEVAGYVELGRWCGLPDDTEVFLESTSKPRRFRIVKRPREKRVSHVRHRRPERKGLTPGEQTDSV